MDSHMDAVRDVWGAINAAYARRYDGWTDLIPPTAADIAEYRVLAGRAQGAIIDARRSIQAGLALNIDALDSVVALRARLTEMEAVAGVRYDTTPLVADVLALVARDVDANTAERLMGVRQIDATNPNALANTKSAFYALHQACGSLDA